MFDIETFIKQHITKRNTSMFQEDIDAFRERISAAVCGKSLLVIGGAGTIGSSFIRAILPFRPKNLVVVDINENGLTELTRDLRSTYGMYVPEDYRTYPLNFADPIFARLFAQERGFDIVANFSAHKHVRSEKDRFSVEALIENNIIKAAKLLDLISEFPPEHYFCVSTDKAANPVNVMGCSKRIMEDLIFSYSDRFKVSTARFANVAFSNGSLLAGFIDRMSKRQPLAAPCDVRRYFVSPEESGQICMLACILGGNGEIFFPKLEESQMMTFSDICDEFLRAQGIAAVPCESEQQAKRVAFERRDSLDKEYPVLYFKSDTDGEKDFEEFCTQDETTDMKRFKSLGVITGTKNAGADAVSRFICGCEALFKTDFTKEQVISLMKEIVPDFNHIEKGKNLDQKM